MCLFVQITPPDKDGYCSLGVSVDVARLAMEQANLVVGEINNRVPRTLGDTFVQISAFDMLVQSDEPLIEDQSCIAFSMVPLFESLGRALTRQAASGNPLTVFQ